MSGKVEDFPTQPNAERSDQERLGYCQSVGPPSLCTALPEERKMAHHLRRTGPAWVVHPTKEAAELFGPVAKYSRSGFGGTERGDPPGQARPTVPRALRVPSPSKPWKVSLT